jgi:Zn-dependent peptidase ImmA (M78 family)
MADQNDKIRQVNALLNGIDFDEDYSKSSLSLRERFDNRIAELGITPTYVLGILNINYRALEGILDGTQRRIDFVTLTKLARFLGITTNLVVRLYIETLEKNNPDDLKVADKRTFITTNFDLATLRAANIISSISDFDHIEERLTRILGLRSIFDYNTDEIEAAFSSGATKPRNASTRKYFIEKSRSIFKTLNNPYDYDKEALIKYFPKIRWHSTDVESGLINVIRSLYKLGVTVIFQPKLPSLQLRGATFAVNEKPCIVLTDYRGFYPTLWFALIHELFHVLFDWQEILEKKYHLSDEESDLFVLKQKEDEANDFAREFLFPAKKMEMIIDKISSEKISDKNYIKRFALDNHVHQSIIYANYAFDNKHENFWAKTQKYMPEINSLLNELGNNLGNQATASEFAEYYKTNLLN